MADKIFNHKNSAGIEGELRAESFERRCPYLGMINDSATSHGYPHGENLCYRHDYPEMITLKVQSHFCLSGAHESCEIFQQEDIVHTEEVAKAPPEWTKKALPPLAIAIPVVLLIIAALIWWPAPWTSVDDNTGQAAPLQKVTNQDEPAIEANSSPSAENDLEASSEGTGSAAEDGQESDPAGRSQTTTVEPEVEESQPRSPGGFRVTTYE
jgi:hypothetical protein